MNEQTNEEPSEQIYTRDMQVVTEFPASEVINNIVKFRFGLVGDDAVIAALDKAGNWGVELFFERRNVPRFIKLMNDVVRGEIANSGNNYISFTAGRDRMGIGEYAPRGNLHMTISNARRGRIDDGLTLNGHTIYTEPNTLLKMKVELERLVEQGKL